MALKIIAIGEAIIDLYNNEDATDNISIEGFCGGAPFNFICACSKLGAKNSILYTNLTDSVNSQKLRKVLNKFNIKVRTHRRSGEPPYAIIKNNGDFDFNITNESLKFSKWALKRRDFWGADLFHFGSLYLMTREGFSATKKAIKRAKSKGLFISFDINYRKDIVTKLKIRERLLKRRILKLLPYVDFIKLNDEEAEFIFNSSKTKKLFKIFSNRQNRNKLFIITKGIKGSDVFHKGQVYSHPAYKANKVVDETGAGDIFLAAFLVKLLTMTRKDIHIENIRQALETANLIAGKSVEYKGAITVLDELEDF